MPELDDSLYQRILRLSRQADNKLGTGACKEAAQMYYQAMELLPSPVEQWEAATWLSGSAANALYMDRQFSLAANELRRALRFPGALDNPFIRLRLGQSLLEIGEHDAARNELLKAYMLGGDKVFEDENPKYFRLIQSLL